jgi:hypothetical protein
MVRYGFGNITEHILQRPDITPHPIDSHVLESFKLFDTVYVQNAAQLGYNKANYFKLFFPVDLIFPIVYTLLFLSILLQFKGKIFYKWASGLIIAGCLLDYGENFSFAFYLISNYHPLSFIVAFFTTTKSIVFAINSLFAIVGLFIVIKSFIKNRLKYKI